MLARITAFLIIFAINIFITSSVQAGISRFDGHVYYDGTNRGVAGIWLKWRDKYGRGGTRYTRTDANGYYNFPPLVMVEDTYRECRIDIDIDGDGRNDAKMIETTNRCTGGEDANFGCNENDHWVTVIQPAGWSGLFVRAVPGPTKYQDPEHSEAEQIKVVNPSTIKVKMNNSQKGAYVGDFFYKPVKISGLVVDDNNQPMPGISVNVYKENGEGRSKDTDSQGRFEIMEFIRRDEIYNVQIINIPPRYKTPAKTTTTGWTQQFINSRDPADAGNKDTPPNSVSYDKQKYGTNDCAGPAGLDTNNTGRCNFQLEKDLSYVPPSPPGSADMCTNTPLNSFTINGKNSSDSLTVPVWLPGEFANTRTVPVAINANGACKVDYIRFNYISTVTTPSSPDPTLCAKPTGRPDGCACNLNTQCQGQKCDQNRQVCFTEAFIETTGGDVHSNVKIEQ